MRKEHHHFVALLNILLILLLGLCRLSCGWAPGTLWCLWHMNKLKEEWPEHSRTGSHRFDSIWLDWFYFITTVIKRPNQQYIRKKRHVKRRQPFAAHVLRRGWISDCNYESRRSFKFTNQCPCTLNTYGRRKHFFLDSYGESLRQQIDLKSKSKTWSTDWVMMNFYVYKKWSERSYGCNSFSSVGCLHYLSFYAHTSYCEWWFIAGQWVMSMLHIKKIELFLCLESFPLEL